MLRTMQEDGKIYAIIPMEEYERLTDEMTLDIAAFDAVIASNEEAFPMALYDSIDAGENPIRAFRMYRGMTLTALAKSAGISSGYLSQIEKGVRKGPARVIKAIAEALHVPMEDLV